MHILLLTHYFPPEVTPGANRAYEHACRWVKEPGVKVTVITNHPHHPLGTIYPGYSNRWFTYECKDGIDLYRVKTFPAAASGVGRRSLNYLVFMLASVVMAWLPRPDLVLASSPQFLCAVAGFLVSRLKMVPFVFELRDIWPESIVTVGAMRAGWFIRVLQKLEMALYRQAASVIALTDSFRDYLVERGIPAAKVSVVTNGVDLNFFQPRPPAEKLRNELGGQDKFIISYIGTVGMAHALEKIVEVAQRLRRNSDIRFVIVGEGAQKLHLIELIASRGLNNIRLLPAVSKEELRDYYASSDLLLVTLKNTPLFRKVIPSKIFEIMAMGRPILSTVGGECRGILDRARSGVSAEPENVEQMVQSIESLFEHREVLTSMGQNGRKFVETFYDRDRLAHQCLGVLTRVLGNKGQIECKDNLTFR